MKLCHIVPSLQLEHGGPSRSVRALCLALARGGDEVELLTTHPDAPASGLLEQPEPRLAVRTFHRDWPARLCPSAGLRRAVRHADAAVVHHHGLWLRTLHYAARATEAPLIISPRGMMSRWAWAHHRGQKALAARFLHPGALEAAAGWHATSQAEAEEIRALGFRQPVCISPNGVNAPTAAEKGKAREYWLAQCPEAASRKVALFYGRFHRKKRVRELVDLWGRLAPSDWLLLLVGIPEDYTVAELQAYAASHAGGTAVRVFDGTSAPPPYPLASVFLLPSHNENFGLTVAEALAHGVPVVVTDTTPWLEVNGAGAGWCGRWEDFATATAAALARSPEETRAQSDRGREWILAEFSWAKAAHRLSTFYQHIATTS